MRTVASCASVMLLAFVMLTVPLIGQDTAAGQRVFTFGFPVQVPGKTLAPGTYVFRVTEERGDAQVVRIFDGAGTSLLMTVMAEPVQNLPGTDLVSFAARGNAAEPVALVWFRTTKADGLRLIYADPPNPASLQRGGEFPRQPASDQVVENLVVARRILEGVRSGDVAADRLPSTSGPATDQFTISRGDLEEVLRRVTTAAVLAGQTAR